MTDSANTQPTSTATSPALLAEAVRNTGPLIQCITNTVVQQFAANALLAIGASPAMLDHEADAGEFAGIASALGVNFGTATSHQFLAADAAIDVMNEQSKPWVLDPVSIGGVAYRTTRILSAAAKHPTAVRGNASEIAALAGPGAGGRGVDSTDSVDDVLPAAALLADRTGAVVGVSGLRDAIVSVQGDTVTIARVSGGSELMPLVIGTGCSLGVTVAAYLAAARALHTENSGAGNSGTAATAHTVATDTGGGSVDNAETSDEVSAPATNSLTPAPASAAGTSSRSADNSGASSVTGDLATHSSTTNLASVTSSCTQLTQDFAAVVAAHAHFAAAGARAESRADGPGTFAPAFLDALWRVSADEFDDVAIDVSTVAADDLIAAEDRKGRRA